MMNKKLSKEMLHLIWNFVDEEFDLFKLRFIIIF